MEFNLNLQDFLTIEQFRALLITTPALIGLVNQVQKNYPKVIGLWAFLVALVTGIILGSVNFVGLTIEIGVLAAFASSGFYKVGQLVGGSNK